MFSNFEEVFQSTVAAYAVISQDLTFVAVNAAYSDMVGQASEDILGRHVFDVFPETPDRQARLLDVFNAALAGTTAQIEEIHYPIAHPDGKSHRWWTIYCSPLGPGADCFLCHFKDMTAMVQSRHKRDLYGAELQHRVGNVLNVVQVLARRTGQTAQSYDDFFPAFDERIAALGKTYVHLSGDNWHGMSLRDILNQQLSPGLVITPQSVVIEGPDWQLSVIHAQVFSMAVHELLINAVKEGALDQREGQIKVTWGRSEDGGYWFDWLETGLADVKPPQTTGFGTEMLLIFLPNQLGGTAKQDFTPTGMHYRLTIPWDVDVPVARDVP